MTLCSIALLKSFVHTKLGMVTLSVFAFFTSLAVTEAFMGQILAALIAAIPTTGVMIIAAVTLRRGQVANAGRIEGKLDENAKALDGKLSDLMKAREEVQHAAGVQQERVEQRARGEEDKSNRKP